MHLYFITFRSVTPAQRGERLLKRGGIRCNLARTPRWMEEQGCGYCLKLEGRFIREAVELLRQERIQFRKIYLQKEAGDVEEVAL